MRSPGWWRAAIATGLLGAIAAGAWWSIPVRQDRFPATTLAQNQLFLFWPQPTNIKGDVQFVNGALRLTPGSILTYDRAKLDGLLTGSFQASSEQPTVVEIATVDSGGRRQILVSRSLTSASAGRRFFVIDPKAHPPNTTRFELAVSSNSPAEADWREFRDVPRAGNAVLAAMPLALLAYEGYTAPIADGPNAYTHAPSQYLFALPNGDGRLEFECGFNPGVFQQREYDSDGIAFRVTLEDETAEQVLWEQEFSTRERPADRELRRAVLPLTSGAGNRLRLLALPGQEGNTAWDWAVWRNIRYLPGRN